MKRIFAALIACALIGVLAYGIHEKVKGRAAASGGSRGPGGGGRAGDRAVAVAVEPIRTITIRDVRLFTGTLRPNSEFQVAPKISGRLAKLTLQVGDPVKRGQLIAELDDAEYMRRVEQALAEVEVAKVTAEKVRLGAVLEDEELVQKVTQAEAELGIAKANVEECSSNLNVAQREYERAKALRGKTILSESGLDEAEANYLVKKARREVALAQVAAREAALKAAKVRLSDTQRNARANDLKLAQAQVAQKAACLKSVEVQLGYTKIYTGWNERSDVRYVGDRFVDEGAMLAANMPLLSIVEIDKLRAFIHVIERDYPFMAVGQAASITTDAYPGETFLGHILRISNVLRETSRQACVEVAIPNQDLRLKPGMFVRLEIEFAKHENATVVPRTALVQRDDRPGLFVVDETSKTARLTAVRLGILNGKWAEILEPAISGSVVTMGHHLLSDGAPVIIPEFSANQD